MLKKFREGRPKKQTSYADKSRAPRSSDGGGLAGRGLCSRCRRILRSVLSGPMERSRSIVVATPLAPFHRRHPRRSPVAAVTIILFESSEGLATDRKSTVEWQQGNDASDRFSLPCLPSIVLGMTTARISLPFGHIFHRLRQLRP
jgi:hypothetical protein